MVQDPRPPCLKSSAAAQGNGRRSGTHDEDCLQGQAGRRLSPQGQRTGATTTVGPPATTRASPAPSGMSALNGSRRILELAGPADDPVADVGCDTGLAGVSLKESGLTIDGSDISKGMLADAGGKDACRHLFAADRGRTTHFRRFPADTAERLASVKNRLRLAPWPRT